MKPRKAKDIVRVLQLKGFAKHPEKDHHQYYFLMVNGKRTHIKTYFSNGGTECDSYLMGQIKKQLKFDNSKKADDFFDCPMSAAEYIDMLTSAGNLKK